MMIACKIFGMFLFSLIVDWNISFLGFAHLPQKRLKEVQQRRHRYGPHQITRSVQWAKLIWVFFNWHSFKTLFSLSLSPKKKKKKCITLIIIQVQNLNLNLKIIVEIMYIVTILLHQSNLYWLWFNITCPVKRTISPDACKHVSTLET